MKITIRELKNAISKNGFKLASARFGIVNADGKLDCGCALTHMYCAENPQPIKENPDKLSKEKFTVDMVSIYMWAIKKYGMDFVASFFSGFDGRLNYTSYDKEGYENGRLLARLMGLLYLKDVPTEEIQVGDKIQINNDIATIDNITVENDTVWLNLYFKPGHEYKIRHETCNDKYIYLG